MFWFCNGETLSKISETTSRNAAARRTAVHYRSAVCDWRICGSVDLAAHQDADSDDEDAGDERPALDGFTSRLLHAVVFDVSQRPVVVTAIRRTAVLAVASSDVRRELTEAAGWRHATTLLRPTTHANVLICQIVQHLLNNTIINHHRHLLTL